MDRVNRIRLSTMRQRLLQCVPTHVPEFQLDPRMLELAKALGRQAADKTFKEEEIRTQKEYAESHSSGDIS